MTNSTAKVIHAAKYIKPLHGWHYLLLRQEDPCSFIWHEYVEHQQDTPTQIGGPTIPEALRQAASHWRLNSYRTIGCGFNYTLPERDEHGCNALLHQMVNSFRSSNGIYFNSEVGFNCVVDRPSKEALALWKKLETEGKLGF